MTTTGSSTVAACCSILYGGPLAELLVGDSFHPGGLASTERLLRASRLLPGASLLDIGCGLGASTRLAAGMFGLCVEAVDPSAPIVDRARARGGDARIRWSVGALPSLAFPAGLFDGVLAECVLSTVDRAAAVPELGRIIRPGGVLLLSDVEVDGDPIPQLGHRLLGAALCVTDAWRPGEMDARLEVAGFRIADRWDASATILDLVDRIERRLGVIRLAARDLGLDLAALVGDGTGATPTVVIEQEEARAVMAAVRSAVDAGSLRYIALIAQARS